MSGSIQASTAIGARVYHNAHQSIPAYTLTLLAFNSERWDTDGIHDTVTNNSRLTCKTAGKYLINGQANFVANATGERQYRIRLNGVTYIAIEGPTVVAAANTWRAVTTVCDLAVNDYVEFVVFQSSGVALNVLAAPNHAPEFMMVRLP